MSYRLDSDSHVKAENQKARASPGGQDAIKVIPNQFLKVSAKVSGRTGRFPPGSREEAIEQACFNFEAQNRALQQRIKNLDKDAKDDSHVENIVNGYRVWRDMDALFSTLGPSPLALSDEIGPAITRGYQDKTTLLKEVQEKLHGIGSMMSPEMMEMDKHLVEMMSADAASHKVDTILRPIIAKDANYIRLTGDMTWCPDPPRYVPLRSLHAADQEMIRLSTYRPHQFSKPTFADINPDYNITEDIWAVSFDRKATASKMKGPLEQQLNRRVKDECLMA